MLLKTLHDEDATTFPVNLFLTRILLAVIWPIAGFPTQYEHEDKTMPFSVSVFMSSCITSSQSTVLRTIPC